MSSKIETIKKYFSMLESFCDDESQYKDILHVDYYQKEFPNALNKNGQESNYNDSIKRLKSSQGLLSRQSYKIINYFDISDSEIVVEAEWEGLIKIDIGQFRQGQELKAFFCIICSFSGSKIISQRNYDCFYNL